MIECLTLENFQAHKKLTVQLDPKVTVVVGPSDAGKSAVIRALTWVMLNTPSGDAFIRNGTKGATTSLVVDGIEILRLRGKNGENTYWCQGQEYKAFGNSVPEAVQKLLAVSELNFQSQHDAPFWFSETSGEVSRKLNAIVNLGAIDNSLNGIVSKVKKARVVVEISEDRLKQTKETYEKLRFVPDALSEFQKVEEVIKRIEGIDDDKRELTELLSIVVEQIKTIDTSEAFAKEGEKIVVSGLKLRHQQEKINGLLQSVEYLVKLKKESEAEIPSFSALDALLSKYNNIQSRVVTLSNELEAVATLIESAESAQADQEVAHEEFHQRIQGQNCPACGKPL